MSRLKLLHSAGSLDWNLQLDSVELEDTGVYECQVRNHKKVTDYSLQCLVF